ncbi:HCL011Wp [Eremothecium sinecaudum]|uniref:HCL011Wp n=1 Tax=Eremothecium sinecaudum TaxID=45286 RepID=A0A0X8HRJ5_9SACH|nr:HCL011Wp [Eremothecium sinecaudum]AMD20140.1 HCL011Wp [Eremothecium sinecaudum]
MLARDFVKGFCTRRLPCGNSRRSFVGFIDSGSTVQKLSIKKLFNSPAKNVYDIVSDISKYQEFVPYCKESFVSGIDPTHRTPVEAGLRIQFQNYDEQVLCKVQCSDNKNDVLSIVAECKEDTLFETLRTSWRISPHPENYEASNVELCLQFKFRSLLYQNLSMLFGQKAIQVAIDVFHKRALQQRHVELNSNKELKVD